MGANDKLDATFHGGEYTPSTGEIVNAWIKHRAHHYQGLVSSDQIIQDLSAEISRGMDKIRAEAKAEALNEYAETLGHRISGAIRKYGQAQGDFRDIIQELRDRANQYNKER